MSLNTIPSIQVHNVNMVQNICIPLKVNKIYPKKIANNLFENIFKNTVGLQGGRIA
jgi:hypothetical protein